MSLSADIGGASGRVLMRADLQTTAAYAVFDCETTGTTHGVDEMVSLAVVRLDAHGLETARFTRLICPSRAIPAEATVVHGISDEDVVSAPRLAEIALELLTLLDGAVFVAHNAPFDLAMLQHAFAGVGIDYRPVGVACTLEAFRLLEPLAPDHRLESICERRRVVVAGAHDAMNDALATAALLRLLLDEDIPPETVELDHEAFLRLRSRGDTRPASAAQIRRVFALGYAAGLDRDSIVVLVARVAGTNRHRLADPRGGARRLRRARPASRGAGGQASGMRHSRGLLLVAALGLLALVASTGVAAKLPVSGQLARIAYVIDGDTVELANGERVRLVQIDTPEVYNSPECYGEKASTITKRLLPAGTLVRLYREPKTDAVDQYGRLLRYVFRVRGDLDVNVQLVRIGAAAPYFYDYRRGRYAGLLVHLLRGEERGCRRGLSYGRDYARAFSRDRHPFRRHGR
jgi:DNA polymerase III epsilon subunit family exonuclease